MSERILVWGAGAIGGTVGAYLVRGGEDVTFVDVVADHVSAIRSTGLRITGPVDTFTIHAKALLPDEVRGPWSRGPLSGSMHRAQRCKARSKRTGRWSRSRTGC